MRKKHRDNALIRPPLVALLESASIFGGETHLQVTPSVGLSVCLSVDTLLITFSGKRLIPLMKGGVTLFFILL